MFLKIISTRKYQVLLEKINILEDSKKKLEEENCTLYSSLLNLDRISKDMDSLTSILLDKIDYLSVLATNELYNKVNKLLDESKFIELSVVKRLLNINLGDFYPYESNMGFFEGFNGEQFIKKYEEAAFGSFNYEIVEGTLFERAILLNDNRESPKYLMYRHKVERVLLKTLAKVKTADFLPYLLN